MSQISSPTFAARQAQMFPTLAPEEIARIHAGEDVVLVGGGKSAGQAAVFLAGYVKKFGCWCAAPASRPACPST